MKKENILLSLEQNHLAFTDYLKTLEDADFVKEKNDKWTAAQHLDHILRSVKPLNLAFSLPSFILKMAFGKANRPSRSYNELVNRYLEKLAQGGRATGSYIPSIVGIDQKDHLLNKLQRQVKNLNRKVNAYPEEQLDKLILPHPLLGKLTLREMLYFTAYHVNHHLNLVQKHLGKEVSISN